MTTKNLALTLASPIIMMLSCQSANRSVSTENTVVAPAVDTTGLRHIRDSLRVPLNRLVEEITMKRGVFDKETGKEMTGEKFKRKSDTLQALDKAVGKIDSVLRR